MKLPGYHPRNQDRHHHPKGNSDFYRPTRWAVDLVELVPDNTWTPHLGDRELECPCLQISSRHARANIIPQVTFQLIENRRVFIAPGGHLPPPFSDCLVEIKHGEPSAVN